MRVSVPTDLAEKLIEANLAKPANTKYRASISEWILEGMSTSSSVITLLQAPQTLSMFAQYIKDRFNKNKSKNYIKIKISEPGRKSEFIVYSHENLETIMEKIKPFLG
ncbi:hypothetical protein HMPREF1978_00384 [Actinomyces graevenitzii F0530]|jgi:hypothetical protein|uniref:Uncharacterized protein n=1 Tax=Actinomyces graevenitzii F0530 TaxID=1321817 RepID=U1PNH0_9ACTO|nr:hypothetical protein [Actinomyces graevenitzii]ERH17720.1 hypothetical protein HMPREF1978_00384 [Actinomyces graevenitzii F0530]